ncbi:hypothetical protein KM915_08825 [Cytobacillus oceanisediminis]|nr:hypothetical protein [Cytobacillus oceanisediminis]
MVLVKYWRVSGIAQIFCWRAQLLIESAYIWCDGTITSDAYAFNWAEVAGRRTYWMKRRISGMMAHLMVMLTHFTGRTAQS